MVDEPTPPSAPEEKPPEEGAASRRGRMIDVQGMIKQASSRVRVDQLVKQGKKYISMLSRERVDELINQSVRTIVDKYRALAAGISGVPVSQIEDESRQEFNELLQQYQEASKAKQELETSKTGLDQEIQDLRKDLERQRALADGRLSEEIEKALIIGFKEFERELERIVVGVFSRRKMIIEAENGPEAAAELAKVEEVLRRIIARLVAAERERYTTGGRDREIALLEKRIEKLHAHTSAMENALRTLSSSKLYSNQQLQNVLRQLGLAPEDKNIEKKREMLKIVLEQNLDLRRRFREMEEKQPA